MVGSTQALGCYNLSKVDKSKINKINFFVPFIPFLCDNFKTNCICVKFFVENLAISSKKEKSIPHRQGSYQCCTLNFFKIKMQCRGWVKSNETNVLLHSISNTMIMLFINLYTQSTYFDNSKMVKWAYIGQKLAKMQGIL